MKRNASFLNPLVTAVSVLFGTLLAACGDGGTAPDEFTIADLAGSWDASELSVTAKASSAVSMDLIASGGAVHWATQPSGNFTGTAVLPGALIGMPEAGVVTLPLSGVMRLTTPNKLRIDFIPEIPPIFTTMDPGFTVDGNRLTILDDTAEFDFDGDQVKEPAVFRAQFVRN